MVVVRSGTLILEEQNNRRKIAQSSSGWLPEESYLVLFPRHAGGIALIVVFCIPAQNYT